MHLTIIITFAALLWFNSNRGFNLLGLGGGASLVVVAGQLLGVWLLAAWSSRRVLRALRAHPGDPHEAQHGHHLWNVVLQVVILLSFLVDLLLTDWPGWVQRQVGSDNLFGLDDIIVLLPFLLSLIGMWLLQYPLDRAIREMALGPRESHGPPGHAVWTLGQYMSFNVRFQLLTVAVPMSVIIVGSDALDRYRADLQSAAGVVWITDFIMGLLVCAVFALAPLMMRYTWTTEAMPTGDLRRRLEQVARRLKLRYRDILIWHSRGMLVNAAVMGILPPLRYVLLSDGLLESMSDRHIEAVFGHEAGHVRFWHIPYFIVFATLSMLIGGGVLLLLEPHLSLQYSQLVVGGVVVILWGVVFGWLSHQFEYQADLAGAASVAPEPADCYHPCPLHAADGALPGPSAGHRVCVTGAREFAAALLRVAALNGIPRDERGWRHPSIDQRIAFLDRASQDPRTAARFARTLLIAKIVLVVGTVAGLVIATWLYRDWLWPRALPVG